MISMGSPPPVALSISPQVVIRVPTTIHAKIIVQPNQDNREICLDWDSLDGDGSKDCWTIEGDQAPRVTLKQFDIHYPTEYGVVAYVKRVDGSILKSVQQTISFQDTH